jgi:hypothetical protein
LLIIIIIIIIIIIYMPAITPDKFIPPKTSCVGHRFLAHVSLKVYTPMGSEA